MKTFIATPSLPESNRFFCSRKLFLMLTPWSTNESQCHHDEDGHDTDCPIAIWDSIRINSSGESGRGRCLSKQSGYSHWGFDRHGCFRRDLGGVPNGNGSAWIIWTWRDWKKIRRILIVLKSKQAAHQNLPSFEYRNYLEITIDSEEVFSFLT